MREEKSSEELNLNLFRFYKFSSVAHLFSYYFSSTVNRRRRVELLLKRQGTMKCIHTLLTKSPWVKQLSGRWGLIKKALIIPCEMWHPHSNDELKPHPYNGETPWYKYGRPNMPENAFHSFPLQFYDGYNFLPTFSSAFPSFCCQHFSSIGHINSNFPRLNYYLFGLTFVRLQENRLNNNSSAFQLQDSITKLDWCY